MAPPTIGGERPPAPVGRGTGSTPTGSGRPGGAAAAARHHHKTRPGQERRSELICRVKYNNSLPDLPFDPKFITCPFGNSRFTNYVSTTLEQQMKYDFITEQDLGVHVDLILPDAYAQPVQVDKDEPILLDPKDEKLLEDEVSHVGDTKRSKLHAQIQSWMRKPDYISTEQTRYQPTQVEKIESRVGYAVRKKMGVEDNIYMDREAQVKAIEKTFEDSQIPITEHYSEKGVYPVEILPVLPDSDMWKYPCAQVIFDSDPAPAGMHAKDQLEIMSQAMIRGVMDDSGEQFVAYFLPTDDTRGKRKQDSDEGKEYDDETEYEYKMAREYNWNVKSKASKGYEENFFFIRREDGIYYNELETRVRLTKRRLRQGQTPSNSKLVVKHRPLNKNEHRMQRYREMHLEPPNEEEEELSEEEEEGIQDTAPRSGSGSRSSSRSSRSRSRSRSRSKSVSKSRSRSRSKSGSRSRSQSKSRSGSPQSRGSRSRSKSGSRSKSRSRSRSKSQSRSRSGSPQTRGSRSGSGSPAGSARSGSRSRSGSPASGRSSSRSRSGSPGSDRSRSSSR